MCEASQSEVPHTPYPLLSSHIDTPQPRQSLHNSEVRASQWRALLHSTSRCGVSSFSDKLTTKQPPTQKNPKTQVKVTSLPEAGTD